MSFQESMRRQTASLTSALSARPGLSLLVIAVITGAVGGWGSGIPIRSDLEALFPDDTPAVVRARAAREVLGSRKELQVLLGGPDKEANRTAALALGARLEAHEDLLNKVEVRRDIAFFETQALLYLPVEDLQRTLDEVSDAIREAVRKDMALDDDFALEEDPPAEPKSANEDDKTRLPSVEELKKRYRADGLSEYFESPDGQVIAVKAYPNFKPTDPDLTRQLTERVQADIDAITEMFPEAGLTATVEGDYAQVTQAVNQIRRDLGWSSALALLVIVILLSVAFRRFRAVVLVVAPLVVGLAWTLALARVVVGSLNLITAFIFAILVGLGIDFAVHAVSRVDEEVAAGRPLREAITRALTGLGRAMIAAVGTTMATFGALVVFDFRGFSQFGLIAAMGVGVCLLAVYTVLPPLAVGLDHLRSRPDPEPIPIPESSGVSHSRTPALWVLGGLLVFTAVAAVGLPRVEFEGDMGKLRSRAAKGASELRKKYRKEAEQRTASPALILTDGLDATQRVHRHLEGELDNIELLDEVASIYSFVPREQEAKLKLVKEIKRKIDMKYGLLEGQAKADADELRPYLSPVLFGVDALPDWVRERFTDTSGRLGRYVLLYPRGRKSDARQVQRIQEAIGEVTVDGETYHSTATWMITGEAYGTVRREGPWAVGLAAGVVFLLLLVDTRRLGATLSMYVPLLLGFVCFLGLLGWLSIPLNLFNVIVLPTIFGIGVDTAIHLRHRIHELQDVRRALRTTGRAAGLAAFTTAVGFASLLMVSNEGLRSIGSVAVLGLVVITAVTTLGTAAFGQWALSKTSSPEMEIS